MLPVPRKDRSAHFVYGACLVNVFVGLAGLASTALGFDLDVWTAACGLALAVAAGAAKEFADKELNRREVAAGLSPSHGVSSSDFAWTAFGGLCASMPTFLILLNRSVQ